MGGTTCIEGALRLPVSFLSCSIHLKFSGATSGLSRPGGADGPDVTLSDSDSDCSEMA